MTATKTPTVRARVDELIGYINQGKILEAMTEFYAPGVEMAENANPPTVGLEANIEREKQFLASVKEWHWTKWFATAVNEADGVAFIEYAFQFTNTQGQLVTYQQATVQHWKNGKIVSERFYHG
jgi:hypothetical protein